MCQCYEADGPKYCDTHKEMTNTGVSDNSGLESMINSYQSHTSNNTNKYK